jgi:hypothetical protein
MKTKLFTAAAIALLTLSALKIGGAAAAEPTPGGIVIAQGTRAQVQKITLGAAPTKPGQITAITQAGARVKLTAKGVKKSKKANNAGIAVFTKLTAGKKYTLNSLGQSTKVTVLNTVAPITELTVRTTILADSVALSWKHTGTKATGGSNLSYRVTAKPETGSMNPGNMSPENMNSATIETGTTSTAIIVSGINPDLLYTFTATPLNAMGPGLSTTATMSVTLRSFMVGEEEPLSLLKVTETPPTELTPTSQPAPTPQSGTKTIYVCPSGFAQTGSNCTKTLPYTYTYTYTYTPYTYRTEVTNRAYTYRTETTGPMPIIVSFETQDVCPNGYNLEDYGVNGKWCRLYGLAPTAQVKDAAPAGFTDSGSNYTKSEQVENDPPTGHTDNGTQWVTTNPAPTGYTDNGTEYVAAATKEAKVVPA